VAVPEELSEEEVPLFPPHLSPSSINTLLSCGERFRLEKVVRVPSRPMWGGVGGSVVHKLTEELDREHYARLKGMEE
jgi:hypothetical protein